MVSLIGGMTGLSAKLIKPVMTNCGIGIPRRREDQENRLLKSKSSKKKCQLFSHICSKATKPNGPKHSGMLGVDIKL